MRLLEISWLRTAWKLVRIPVILVVLYLTLHPIMGWLSQRHGFGSPDGLSPGYLVVSVVTVALRLVLLVVVPAVLTYRVVAGVITHILRRADSPTPPSGEAG
jgi:hypothetical protein